MGSQKATVTFEVEHIRNIGQIARKDAGGFTSVQAEAFLALYGPQLQAAMESVATRFINEKLR